MRFTFQLLLEVSIFFVLINSRSKKSQPKVTGQLPIYSFNPGGQYICLTFENGPHATITPTILDILEKKGGVHATFFVNGRKAIYQKHLIQRMIESGHEIANYGSHDKNASISNYQQLHAIENIKFTSKLIYSFTNIHTQFYRPPTLVATSIQQPDKIMDSTNLTVIMYSFDLAHNTAPLSSTILHKLDQTIKPGDIINLLDTSLHTIAFLPTLVDILQNHSYEFLTLSQISSFPDDKPH